MKVTYSKNKLWLSDIFKERKNESENEEEGEENEWSLLKE